MILYKKQHLIFDNIFTSYIDQYKPGFSSFFHCTTTGHYWRNSHITELSLLTESEKDSWLLQTWNASSDTDEYDLLCAFSNTVSQTPVLIGYNSTSFHIPYLNHKTSSYNMTSIFSNKQHIDLLQYIRPIGKRLNISTKLNDLRIMFNIPDTCSEIECIARSTGLFLYAQIFDGNFTVSSASRVDDEILFFCTLDYKLPTPFRMNCKEFYLIGEDRCLKIKVKLIDGQLKLFYPNYKDYFYLLEEEIIIHKSLAASIAKDKKRKALPEECFSYIAYTEHLEKNLSAIKKYLCALLNH